MKRSGVALYEHKLGIKGKTRREVKAESSKLKGKKKENSMKGFKGSRKF
jgi:hypothetical protein